MVVIREFAPQDGEAVSALIRHTMRVSNSHDYPLARLQPLMDYFSPDKVRQLNQERLCLVAEISGQLIGTIGLEGTELVTFFVHPEHQGKGIGKQLLTAIEECGRAQGITRITVDSSLTGAVFYARMGYERTGVEREGTAGPQIGMEKRLVPSHSVTSQ
ncbi:MAG TPA: GNAT family N-acetyltransferase [Roseiflexaceae bacterium]|nr:GNAT family N-acetyltransferase [Roseiflexaceae bacterium]